MTRKNTVLKGLALVAALGALHGCGGGGGNGGFFLPQSDAEAKAPDTETVDPTPTPAPDSGTEVDPTACITAPQPGSTAAVGNELEGVWRRKQTGAGFLMIDSTLRGVGWTYLGAPEGMFDGAMSYSVPNGSWQFDSGVVSSVSSSQWAPLSGQGSFAAKSTINGTYADGTGAQSTFGPWLYDVPTNSLAISPELLQGEWRNTEQNVVASITVGADGVFAGASPATSLYGACAFSGTLEPSEPGTKKNSLKITLLATSTAQAGERACVWAAATGGVGAVMVDQNTTDGSCKQSTSLRWFLRDASGHLAGGPTFLR